MTCRENWSWSDNSRGGRHKAGWNRSRSSSLSRHWGLSLDRNVGRRRNMGPSRGLNGTLSKCQWSLGVSLNRDLLCLNCGVDRSMDRGRSPGRIRRGRCWNRCASCWSRRPRTANGSCCHQPLVLNQGLLKRPLEHIFRLFVLVPLCLVTLHYTLVDEAQSTIRGRQKQAL